MNRKHDTVTAYRARARAADKAIDEELARQRSESLAAWKDERAKRKADEAARVRLIQADLMGAEHVRDEFGWHKVIRVNKISTTVEHWSGSMLLTNSKILERRPVVVPGDTQ